MAFSLKPSSSPVREVMSTTDRVEMRKTTNFFRSNGMNVIPNTPTIPEIPPPTVESSSLITEAPRETATPSPHITVTTIIIVVCVITSCVVLAFLAACGLSRKRKRTKKIDQSKIPKEPTCKQAVNEAEIYAEIDTHENTCCFCWKRKPKHSSSQRTDIGDNIYDEVADVRLTSCRKTTRTTDGIYETLDHKRWPGQECPPQGHGSTPIPQQEVSRTTTETSRLQEIMSPRQTYLDDADTNNNSLVRRLSQKLATDRRTRHFVPVSGSDVQGSATSGSLASSDVTNSHEYFVLEDIWRRKKPPVPVRTCSLKDPPGNRCVSFPSTSENVHGNLGRRVRSYPVQQRDFSSQTSLGYVSTVSSGSVSHSAASSEGVYNIKTGNAERISSCSGQQRVRARNDYFILDPTFARNDSDQSVISDKQRHAAGASKARNDYFVLEPETDQNASHPVRFQISEADDSCPRSRRHVLPKQSVGGVTVVRLKSAGLDETGSDSENESLYDRLRFKSVSEMSKPPMRPRLFSTPITIDY